MVQVWGACPECRLLTYCPSCLCLRAQVVRAAPPLAITCTSAIVTHLMQAGMSEPMQVLTLPTGEKLHVIEVRRHAEAAQDLQPAHHALAFESGTHTPCQAAEPG